MAEKKFEEGKVYLFESGFGCGYDGGKIQYKVRIVKKTEKTIKAAISMRYLELYGAVCDNVESQKFSEEKITGAKKIQKTRVEDAEYFNYDNDIFCIRYAKEVK